MKFVVSKDLERNKGMSLFMLFFFAMISVFLLMNPVVENSKWGLNPIEVQNTILGDEESFIEPMALQDLVAHIHVEFFIYLFILVMALTVLFRSKYSFELKVGVSLMALLSCVLNAVSPALLYMGLTGAAWMKVSAFWGLTFGLAIATVLNIRFLARGLRE